MFFFSGANKFLMLILVMNKKYDQTFQIQNDNKFDLIVVRNYLCKYEVKTWTSFRFKCVVNIFTSFVCKCDVKGYAPFIFKM